ncbi:MAG: efflux RND transporter periplasmic adaptor subunit [Rhizobiaceae bacterium]
MKLTSISVTGLIAATMFATQFAAAEQPAFAGSASDAVSKLSKKAPKTKKIRIKRKKAAKLDRMTTGTIKSNSKFDARGVVVPNAEVTLAAAVSTRIQRMPFKPGQAFQKGETLIQFDCERQLADLRGAEATLGKAATFYNGKKRLRARGAAGGQEVREAASDVAAARAGVDSLKEVIDLCRIEAPFSGRVVERHAETHEIPAINAPVMTVVDSSTLELDLIVPSTWLRWMKEGTKFEFAVDELGQRFPARVQRLGAKVDPVSQTIKLTGVFAARPNRVLAGMSGTAKFVPPSN